MIVCTANVSEEERLAFIQGVCKKDVDDKDLGFLEA
jgi:hypothetical protein